MREIMSHTAGFGYGLCGDDPVNTIGVPRSEGSHLSKNLDEMITKIAGIPLIYDPGTRWSYSVSVDIQGYIVQKLSGQKFGDYLKANIFTPLGMNETSFILPKITCRASPTSITGTRTRTRSSKNEPPGPSPAMTRSNEMESGGGGLLSTAHDYARFSQMLLNKGTLAGNTVVKPETIALMAQNQIGDLGIYSDGTAANPGRPGQKFGLDFAVYTDPEAGQNPFGKGTFYWSGAAGTIFWIDPVNDIFFVGLVQQMGGSRPDAMNFRNDSGKLILDA
jgi:CubicO group peptidase (beta-lactamase class C family)